MLIYTVFYDSLMAVHILSDYLKLDYYKNQDLIEEVEILEEMLIEANSIKERADIYIQIGKLFVPDYRLVIEDFKDDIRASINNSSRSNSPADLSTIIDDNCESKEEGLTADKHLDQSETVKPDIYARSSTIDSVKNQDHPVQISQNDNDKADETHQEQTSQPKPKPCFTLNGQVFSNVEEFVGFMSGLLKTRKGQEEFSEISKTLISSDFKLQKNLDKWLNDSGYQEAVQKWKNEI